MVATGNEQAGTERVQTQVIPPALAADTVAVQQLVVLRLGGGNALAGERCGNEQWQPHGEGTKDVRHGFS